VHVGRLEDERLLRASHFLLAVGRSCPRSSSPSGCRACADRLARAAAADPARGLRRECRCRSTGAASEIPVARGVTYFSLGLQSEYWRPVLDERSWRSTCRRARPERVKVELLAVRGRLTGRGAPPREGDTRWTPSIRSRPTFQRADAAARAEGPSARPRHPPAPVRLRRGGRASARGSRGTSQRDADASGYALVALIDEVAMGSPSRCAATG